MGRLRTSIGMVWVLGGLMTGCWVTQAEVYDKLGLSTSEGDFTIYSVEPDFGSTAGGYEVAIRVDLPDSDVQVMVGATPATVLSVDDDGVVVEAPPGVEGWTDIRVDSGGGFGRLTHGFQYWPDGAGRFGAIGSISWYDVVGTLSEDFADSGYGWLTFVEPTEQGYSSLFGGVTDGCRPSEDIAPLSVSKWATGATEVTLSSEAVDLRLGWNEESELFEVDLEGPEAFDDVDRYLPGTDFELTPVESAPTWPSFGVSDFVTTQKAFTVYVGSGFDGMETLQGTLPTTRFSDFRIQWSGGTPGDYMVAMLERWVPGVDTEVDNVRCLIADDNSFTVPSSVWSSTTPGYVNLYLGRVNDDGAILPLDGSSSSFVGVHWMVGTVIVQY